MSQPELTPKQQALMDFLNQLATTPLTPERLAEGNKLLDAAADECQQKLQELTTTTTNEAGKQ